LLTYAIALNPFAPPHPINTIENVNVEIVKPKKPNGVGFAKFVAFSCACATFGFKYNYVPHHVISASRVRKGEKGRREKERGRNGTYVLFRRVQER